MHTSGRCHCVSGSNVIRSYVSLGVAPPTKRLVRGQGAPALEGFFSLAFSICGIQQPSVVHCRFFLFFSDSFFLKKRRWLPALLRRTASPCSSSRSCVSVLWSPTVSPITCLASLRCTLQNKNHTKKKISFQLPVWPR